MAVSLAMLTVTAALQRFACLFIFYHAADRKSDRCCNHQQNNCCPHTVPPFHFASRPRRYAIPFIDTFSVSLSLYGRKSK